MALYHLNFSPGTDLTNIETIRNHRNMMISITKELWSLEYMMHRRLNFEYLSKSYRFTRKQETSLSEIL